MPLEGTAEAVVDQPTGVAEVLGETTPSADPNAPPQDPAAAGEGAETAELPDPGLLAPEEYARLQGDPKALIKALNKGFTQKMQSLSEADKILQAYRRDPQATLRILAEHNGLSLGAAPAPTPSTEAIDKISTILTEALGPELAAQLKPAFEELAKNVVGSEIRPIKDYMDQGLAQAALAETKSVMTQFATKYPDWQKHESKMMDIAAGFQPGPNTDPIKYMEHLYKLATFDLADADRVRGTIGRINDAAAASDKPTGTVSGAKVAQTPKKFASVEDAAAAAFAAAKQGIRWEPRA